VNVCQPGPNWSVMSCPCVSHKRGISSMMIQATGIQAFFFIPEAD
jgi:hypothetical protein